MKDHKQALYMKVYRKHHPEKVLQHRINSNINFLQKQGYEVGQRPTSDSDCLQSPSEAQHAAQCGGMGRRM